MPGMEHILGLYQRLGVGESAIAMHTRFPPNDLDKEQWFTLRWLYDCGLIAIVHEEDPVRRDWWRVHMVRCSPKDPPKFDFDSAWFSTLCDMWWPRHLSPSWSVETPEERSERRRRAIARWRSHMRSLRKSGH